MSKKVAFPVMSTTITGILFIVAVLLVTLRSFLNTPGLITDISTGSLLSGLLGFLAAFILFWALLGLSLHPSLEQNVKTLFVIALVILLVSILAMNFNTVIRIGKLV